ncbi:MAG: RluA family pseudouridine synthase [Clostridia bacterium]|nr:RluA family pseudouridine synthase [Clostridia bacterium]
MKYIIDNEYVGMRIDKVLSLINSEYTRSYIQKMLDEEKITLNGSDVKSSYKVKLGDVIEVGDIEIKQVDVLPEDIKIEIVYEDDDVIVVNKEKGMVVHPGNGNYEGTLVNALMYSHKDELSAINGVIRPGIVHRIDKDTSGILVVAKNDKAHKILSDDFKVHNITRKYVAIVKGIVEKDNIKIDLPIGRAQNDRIKMAVTEKNSRNAVTYIKVLERFYKSGYTLIEAKLETGRTHQIRVHMSYIGHPLLGDEVYSKGKNEFDITGQMLHAKVLGFNHPITKEYLEFSKQEPEEFKEVLEQLRNKEK